MKYTQYTGIPIWVAWCCLPREDHYIPVGSGVNGIVFAPQVVCRIMYLHCLDRVDGVVRNDDRVAFLVRKGVVAITNI
jgi:hypothetical protein